MLILVPTLKLGFTYCYFSVANKPFHPYLPILYLSACCNIRKDNCTLKKPCRGDCGCAKNKLLNAISTYASGGYFTLVCALNWIFQT